MGLSLNKSPFLFPGFPALCAQGWVPIQSRRFCALFLLEMWASEKRKAGRKQHSRTGCEHTRLLVPREATVIQLSRHLLNTKCALGSIYSQVLHREGTPGPLCELTHQVSVILSWGQQTASAGGWELMRDLGTSGSSYQGDSHIVEQGLESGPGDMNWSLHLPIQNSATSRYPN